MRVVDLNRDPGVEIISGLEGRLDREGNPLQLVKGFLPFQVQGINFMKECERCIYFQWSTGSGKTIAAEGTILWCKKYRPFELCLYVVKPRNLENTRRKLLAHTGLHGIVLEGSPVRRVNLLESVAAQMEDGLQPIIIMNAEKFREDKEWLKVLVEDASVLVVFDEMPMKYSNRETQVYRATAEVFYTSYVVSNYGRTKGKKIFYPMKGRERTREVFFVASSATPIDKSPEDFFNSVRMMDSSIFGSVSYFKENFIAYYDDYGNPAGFKDLDRFGEMAASIVHQADKDKDPAIKAQFPVKLPLEVVALNLDPVSNFLYKTLAKEYRNRNVVSILSRTDVLAAIECLQMICNNPRSVYLSAQIRQEYEDNLRAFLDTKPSKTEISKFEKKYKEGNAVALKLVHLVHDDAKFTDRDAKGNCINTKMLDLREKIENHDDKVIVFTAENQTLLPFIEEWFDEWGITYVTYHGELTRKESQRAQDEFRTNPDVKVFLSSDAGGDSIDLPEATLTIHYSGNYSWAKMLQRDNRQDRIDSIKDVVRSIILAISNSVEDRKAEIREIKKGYHNQVFGGEIADQAEDIRTNTLLYLLTGDEY